MLPIGWLESICHGVDLAIERRAAVPVVYFGYSTDGEGGGSLSLGDVVCIRIEHSKINRFWGGAFACLTGVIYSLIRECHNQCLRLREHDGTVFGPPRNGNLRILHLLGRTGVAQGESVVDIPLLVRRPAGFHYFQRIIGDGVLAVSISAVSAAYSARAIGIVGSCPVRGVPAIGLIG